MTGCIELMMKKMSKTSKNDTGYLLPTAHRGRRLAHEARRRIDLIEG
jgi:hypothetical protein